jgi:ComF family protein
MTRSPCATFSRQFGYLASSLLSVAFPAGCRLCDRLLLKRLQATGLRSLPFVVPAAYRGALPSLWASSRAGQNAWRRILLLKYERVEPLGAWFAKRLAELINAEPGLLKADVTVPVPLDRFRQKERGFNQVDLFGRPLARILKLPYRPVLLVRERPRPEQHLLRNDERWEAVRGAFAIQKGLRVDNLRVLLLDDVMTTGATLDACSRALREAGAVSAVGLTIARAVRSNQLRCGE